MKLFILLRVKFNYFSSKSLDECETAYYIDLNVKLKLILSSYFRLCDKHVHIKH